MNFTTQNEFYEQYQSKRVVVLIEKKFKDNKCFHI